MIKGMLPLGLMACLVGNALATSQQVDGLNADLIYDFRTGDVVLDASDTPSGVIVSFVLNSPQAHLRPWEIPRPIFPNHLDNIEDSPRQITEMDLSFQGWSPIPLGPILPAGLRTRAELVAVVPVAKYSWSSQPGAGGNFDLVLVPEPSPLLTIGIGTVMAAAWLACRRMTLGRDGRDARLTRG